MKFRKLGNTGFDVSEVGFGTWQLGGKRWKGMSDAKSIKLLRDAQNLGVNIFDAAVVYGQYSDKKGYLQSKSQELLGKAFSKKRDHVYYCIKLGQFDEYAHKADYDPARLVHMFKQSLRRLKTDYIDICLIHAPSLYEVKIGKAIGVLQTLQALGLVKAIGYSFENEPGHVKEAIKQNIDVIMLQYNLIDKQCAKSIQEAELKGIGILVGGPLKRGYLTGKFENIKDLPRVDDYWTWNLNHNKDKVKEILVKVNKYLSKYKTPANLRKEAFEFILEKSGVGSVVIGHRALHEIKENTKVINEI